MKELLLDANENILPSQGAAFLFPEYFSPAQSVQYFESLKNGINWKQEPIKIFGKVVMQPRLTAWYGDIDKKYSYSGITMIPQQWTNHLLEIKSGIEKVAGVNFTNALLNYYRDENDSMGWHRDNEKELGINPVIGSVSFGATRTFQFRNYNNKKMVKSIDLTNGSLLLMKGETQYYWEHRLPKTAKKSESRINITFRVII